MIPIRDTVKSRTVPFVNYALIAACGAVFLYELSLGGRRLDHFLRVMAVTPTAIAATVFHGYFAFHPVWTLVASMFLHAGWMHLLGNMLYLYIFGNSVEGRLGHAGYLVFYLLAGVGAALVEVYFDRESSVPLLGASGAIAGVLGAYFILFPRAWVLTAIPLFVFFPVVEVPAFLFLGFWFLMQFLQGTFSQVGSAAGGGVAWWAHAGGFVIGAVLLPFFLLARRRRTLAA